MLQNPAAARFAQLVGALSLRALKVRYRGSVLGPYWSFLNPVIMTAVYTAIFSSEFQRYYQGSALRYGLAVYIALVAVNFFSSSTSAALPSVVGNGMLLNKIKLPIAIFPVSMISAQTFQLLVGNVPAIILITILISRDPSHLLILPLPLAGLILLSAGVGFVVSSLFVFFRDIPYFYELVTFLLWLTSPVFYPINIVPEQLRPVLWFNPLFPIFESLRQLALNPGAPDLRIAAISFAEGVVACALGWLIFRSLRARFMDYIS